MNAPTTPNIANCAMLVVLSMPQWSFSKKDKEAAREIAEQHGVNPKYVRAHKDLIDKDSLEASTKLRAKAREYHYDHTSPFADKGPRVLMNKVHLEYVARMGEFKAEIDRLDDVFCASVYPELCTTAPARLGSLYNPLDFPPSGGAIRGKFGFDWWFYKLPEASDFDSASDLTPEQIKQIASSSAAHVQDGFNDAVLKLADRMRTCVQRVIDSTALYDAKKAGGATARLHDTMIGNIVDLVKLVPALNITGNKAIDDLAAEMELTLCRFDTSVLKESKQARADAAARAKAILDKINADFAPIAHSQEEAA